MTPAAAAKRWRSHVPTARTGAGAGRRGRRGRRSLAAALLLTMGAVSVQLAPTQDVADAAVLPPGLQDTVVIPGLATPTAVRFAPDGRIFVAEKRGTVKVFTSLADRAPRTVVDLSAQVHDYSDRGLLGLAVPPDLRADPAIYVSYAVDAPAGGPARRWDDGCPTPPGGETDGCLVTGRLSRLPLNGDQASGEQVLIDGWCQQFSSHSVGSLAFDRTGALIVSGGDGASYNGVDYGQLGGTYAGYPANPCGDPPGPVGTALTAPNAEGGALRSQSIGRLSGPTVLNGTILRVDPLTGAARTDNPMAGSTDPDRARIIAAGLRNPFRFTVRPGTDEIWLGDVGWNHTEEINRIASTTDGVVENFGWPCYEGKLPQAGYQGAGLAACKRLYDRPGAVTAPHYDFPHNAIVVQGDGCPPGGSSVSGTAFNVGTRYPAYDGALFFADYSRNCIWAMNKGANGDPDPSAISVVVSEAAGPVDLQMGPDGWLYYVGIFDGAVHRIETGAPATETNRYMSALTWTSMTNGWGPVELDRNVGDQAAGDGGPLMIDGKLHTRGLGAHAVSSVTYAVPAGCTTFSAVVGLDDSAALNGSVVYRVSLDAVEAYVSPRLTGSSAALPVDVPLGSASTITLHVDNGGDNNDFDHADWGSARMVCGTGTPPPPPPPPPSDNRAPTTQITSPLNPGPWSVGDRISFAGSASDPESGVLPPSALTWKLLHHHCPDGVCHTHFIQEWKGVSSGSFAAGDIDYPGWYEVTLTATDPGGASSNSSVRLDPRTVNLTFDTNPRGLKLAGLVVGSGAGTTPFTKTVIVGSANTVSAPSPQNIKNKSYSFISWSDGGAQNHTIVAPATARTYTATYRQR